MAAMFMLPVDAHNHVPDQRQFKPYPALNCYTHTSPRGLSTPKIRCDTETSSNDSDQKIVDANDFEDCIGRCGKAQHTDWCNFAAYPGNVDHPESCYLKKGKRGILNVSNEQTKGTKGTKLRCGSDLEQKPHQGMKNESKSLPMLGALSESARQADGRERKKAA